VQRNVRHILKLLEIAACEDCGEPDAVVLDFDHIGPKLNSVVVLAFAGYGMRALQCEIAECEIRCANCHRRRTSSAAGYYRCVASV